MARTAALFAFVVLLQLVTKTRGATANCSAAIQKCYNLDGFDTLCRSGGPDEDTPEEAHGCCDSARFTISCLTDLTTDCIASKDLASTVKKVQHIRALYPCMADCDASVLQCVWPQGPLSYYGECVRASERCCEAARTVRRCLRSVAGSGCKKDGKEFGLRRGELDGFLTQAKCGGGGGTGGGNGFLAVLGRNVRKVIIAATSFIALVMIVALVVRWRRNKHLAQLRHDAWLDTDEY